MGRKKRCVYGSCRNDTRNLKDSEVFFIPFPKPKKNYQKSQMWLERCGRLDGLLTLDKINADTYVCSRHFEGLKGPTEKNPDILDFRETVEYKNYKKQYYDADDVGVAQGAIYKKEVSSFNDSSITNATSASLEFSMEGLRASPCSSRPSYLLNKDITSSGTETLTSPQFNEPYLISSSTSEILTGGDTAITQHSPTTSSSNQQDNSSGNNYLYLKFRRQFLKFVPSGWALSFDDIKQQIIISKLSLEYGSIIATIIISLPPNTILKPEISLKVLNRVIPHHHVSLVHLENCFLGPDVNLISMSTILEVVDRFNNFNICRGIGEKKYIEVFHNQPVKSAEFCFHDNSVHSTFCDYLTTKSICQRCKNLKKFFWQKCYRKLHLKTATKFKHSKNTSMSRKELIKKLNLQKKREAYLKSRVGKIRKLNLDFKNKGQLLEKKDSFMLLEVLEKEKNRFDKNSDQNIFIEEQIKALQHKNKRNRRWHPKMIQWCLYLHNKSSRVYDAMAKSDCFELPSRRTLYNYASHLGSKSGFSKEAFQQLKELIEEKCKDDNLKYFSIAIDEIKVKENIVYKNNTGELIGFVNLNSYGNTILNEKCISDEGPAPVATHILQVMVQGITNNISFPLAFFPVDHLDSDTLLSIVWEAIAKLEFCHTRILAVISDGASVNRKMLKKSVDESGYKCINPFALDEERDIYFICDVPHLIKTARNCFASSGTSLKCTRNLTKNGQNIHWKSIVQLFDEDVPRKVKQLPKLTMDHVYLSSYSRMKVSLAAQVLSSTVANALEKRFGNEVKETVEFIRILNKYFDIMNTRNFRESIKTRNSNLAPFQSENDERLKWLEKDFVSYLTSWEDEVRNNFDNLRAEERNKMLLSRETMEGLKISAHSTVAVVRFLLRKGVKFVLTNKLNQDRLEREFGKHRGALGGNTNPDVYQFGQNVDSFKKVENPFRSSAAGNISYVCENM